MRLVSGEPPQGAHQAVAVAAKPTALPTARARVAIDEMAVHGTYDAFNATMPNIKALLGDVVNWHGTPRLTKVVNKAVIGSLSATHEPTGTSYYPHALEMLSYLAMCAPMLEPDRLARIATLALETPNAYKPIRYIVKPTAQLQRLLGRYSDVRKEALLASLWTAAHDGRWWDHATGAEPGERRRRRHRTEDDMPAEQREAIAEQVRDLLAGQATPTARGVAAAFESRLLTFSDQAASILGSLRLNGTGDHRELVHHLEHPDWDVRVLLSYVRPLLPDERPESPIPSLIESLVRDLGDDIDNADALPEKPDDWSELYPAASRDGFPMPNRVRQLEKAAMPALPGAVVRMMRHADMLKKNANHMGNCTFSYRPRCENGQAFIGHLAYLGGEYNFAIQVFAPPRPDAPPRYALGEVNSRFNRGNVPQNVRATLHAIVEGLNA